MYQGETEQTVEVDLHHNWQAKTDALKFAVALLHQSRACISQRWKVLFQADVAKELDVVCRH